MKKNCTRRYALKAMAAASSALVCSKVSARDGAASLAEKGEAEVQVTTISDYTFRLSLLPIVEGKTKPIPANGSLLRSSWNTVTARLRGDGAARTLVCGNSKVQISESRSVFKISNREDMPVQQLTIDAAGSLLFEMGDSPVLGLGEGGAQFDRRGSVDKMISGQGGYKLHTHGGRVPIPWLVGTAGWAMYIHQPFGSFDFTGVQGRFSSEKPGLALDVFFVASQDPAILLSEYARLTGHAQMPPLWSFGYQQSHRTLASKEEVLEEAKTFREKSLPCEALIYLGTGFCPSGWNTQNGSFVWNSKVFPDPKQMLNELHQEHFKVVLHSVILTDKLRGTVDDPCDVKQFNDQLASCHWDAHRKDFALGVDGWWPDEGDPLDIPSRLVRNRLYWEGPQLDRPSQRPYALHRNGYAGMQRYASFLWSGDVYSTWETLKTQVPIAINTSLTGIPFWGTDIGGFVPTKEFTAELYLRWFQFGAFCTLFRSHGRAWKLRLPWGWNTGDVGPAEIIPDGNVAVPDARQLHNQRVEPICKKYLELRYQLLPYLYSAVHECTVSGVPVMRALWLHYPDDLKAVSRGDEYLWGRSILVAPVTEPDAKKRNVYLPGGNWYDYWTGEVVVGGREIERSVDLETMPLYVRAGSIVPIGPVKQYVSEPSDQPLSICIYPGADASYFLYEDDGVSFNYRKGEWTGIEMSWNDAQRKLSLKLANGSRMLTPSMKMEAKLRGGGSRPFVFDGRPTALKF